ncbi:hypothetical protein NE237_032078 [Protea cynaroides]|uniref:Uncharacterized protein n=1 Tax=Protea cynaroides TaxID=273540 RepID=A0A9Q0L3B9_9MAGN|nr:hypothetical protein NE237_032078 [Protea cynaroides]
MHVDSSEEALSGPVAKGIADSYDNEQKSSSHAIGADEVPTAAAPQAKASGFTELQGLLVDACSLVAALDDHQCSLQTKLDSHKRRMLQNITRVKKCVISLEQRFIASEAA